MYFGASLSVAVLLFAIDTGCVRRPGESLPEPHSGTETPRVAKPEAAASPPSSAVGVASGSPPVDRTPVSSAPSSPVTPAPRAGDPAMPPSSADEAAAAAYVFSPERTVSARPGTLPAGGSAPPDRGMRAASPDPATSRPASAIPSPGENQPMGTAELRIAPSSSEAAPGDVIEVDVVVSSSASLVDAPLHLRFDPEILAYVDAVPGDFLAQGGSSVVFLADGQSRAGDVALALGRVDRASGAAGAGLLCRVRLRVVGSGKSNLSIGEALAWDASNRVVPVTVAVGSVSAR